MKTIGTSKKKTDKPFLAARIPAGLSDALEAHVKSKEESKTEALINALSVYLGWTDGEATQPSASDRLSMLETRLNELERLVKEPRQTSLLDDLEHPKRPNIKESHKPQPVIKEDKNIDNNTDKMLNNREMSQLSGMNHETVRSRHKTEKTIVIGGKSYRPFKDGKSCLWDPN